MTSYVPPLDVPMIWQALLVWAAIGLVAGWLASLFLGGGGIVRNIVVGMIGSIVGGYLFSALGIELGIGHFWIRHILTATIGAVVVIAIARVIAK